MQRIDRPTVDSFRHRVVRHLITCVRDDVAVVGELDALVSEVAVKAVDVVRFQNGAKRMRRRHRGVCHVRGDFPVEVNVRGIVLGKPPGVRDVGTRQDACPNLQIVDPPFFVEALRVPEPLEQVAEPDQPARREDVLPKSPVLRQIADISYV